MGVTQGAGLSLRWFRDQFGVTANKVPDGDVSKGDPYDSLTAEAARVPPGADGLLWAPYLMGERTPHLDPDARAALVGLTASHTRAHVVRAILEGVAFSLRDSFEILKELNVPCETIRLGGGGARSELWRQIQADVYGHEVETMAAEEGAAYGVAILAGVAAGAWPSVETACDAVIRPNRRVQPDPDAAKLFHRQYRQYVALYPALRSISTTEGPHATRKLH
jgi:xylulokinase